MYYCTITFSDYHVFYLEMSQSDILVMTFIGYFGIDLFSYEIYYLYDLSFKFSAFMIHFMFNISVFDA